tara:strand:- start:14 stop:520 length:507 start_codon:yes stop_codon:yes gene_type:complete
MRITLIILIIILFTSKNSYTLANDKIAFVDLNFILKESNEGQKILSDLNDLNNKNLNQFKKEENELEKEHGEIKKLQNIISFEEYNKKLTSFQNKVDIYKEKKNKMINSFETVKDKELSVFFNNLNKIMNNYMKNNSINIILDKKNIIMAKTRNDISKEILNIVNNND